MEKGFFFNKKRKKHLFLKIHHFWTKRARVTTSCAYDTEYKNESGLDILYGMKD